MPLLEIQNLHATVGDKEILKGINLVIKPGQVHAIMGPNGSGKSTLSYILAGRDGYDVTKGEVLFDGKDLLSMPADERRFVFGFSVPSGNSWRRHDDVP